MRCPHCQFENPENTKFCGECGTRFDVAEKTPGSDIPPSPAKISPSDLKGQITFTRTLETRDDELGRGTFFAGRYEIIEELGAGGMGKVYRAFDKKIEDEVALKLLKPEIAADKRIVERFRNELKIARKIRHANVCGMFDLGEEGKILFISMEYVRGEDLKSLIRRTEKLTVGKAVSIIRQVAEGLAEAHKLGVIHRDLKPHNIMIDREGNAKIMDFGIARTLAGVGATAEGAIIGTPEYMSPEQVEGKAADQRADIYALGVTLFEMLTGRVPFEGETPFCVANKHRSEPPPDPRRLAPQISDALSRLVLRCLEKERDKRYQTAEELITDLDRVEKEDRGAEELLLVKPGSSIAVLPFMDLSSDKDQEYFCDGLAEELINALTKIQDLKVASRTSAFAFKGKDMDIRQVGERLQVKAVLEGSMRKAGTRVRVTAQLIDVSNGYHIWSERYDRELHDVFAIQEEIALAIADKLKPQLLREEKAKLLRRSTEDVEAFHCYLRGRFFWNKRTEEDLKKGVENFELAIARDPRFALAYSGLADSYITLGYRNFIPPDEAFAKAEAAARKAIELDDTLAEAFVSLANVKLWVSWDLAGAEQGYKRALELNPANGEAHHQYAHLLPLRGRFDDSIQEMKKALELEPFSVIINSCLGQNLYLARSYDEAVEQLQKTIEMDPHLYDPYNWLGLSYIKKGLYDQAILVLQKMMASGDVDPRMRATLGHALAAAGEKQEAMNILTQLLNLTGRQATDPYFIAWAQAGFVDREQTLAWLNKAYEARSMWVLYLKIDPIFDFLRSDPKFIKLLEKIGLGT